MSAAPHELPEDWSDRFRELARAQVRELASGVGFPIYGVSGELAATGTVASYGQRDGVVDTVVLVHGDPLSQHGPYVEVRTERAATVDTSVALDEERLRIAEHAGVIDPEPTEPPVACVAELDVQGERVAAYGHRHGGVTALSVVRGGIAVTVVARGTDPAGHALVEVTDLVPYGERRAELIRRLYEAHRAMPDPEPPPATGAEALRALVEHCLDQAYRIRRAQRRVAGEGRLRSVLWRRAVAEQQRLTGEQGGGEDDAVTVLVNHLISLQEKSAWWDTDEASRGVAVAETIGWALGEPVPSARAQRAWAAIWHERLGPDADPDPRSVLGPEQLWLAAWDRRFGFT